MHDLLGMTVEVPGWLQDLEEELEAIVYNIEAGIASNINEPITSLLGKYIEILEEENKENFIASQIDTEIIEEQVGQVVAGEIEVQELPSATIDLNIYSYEGEGE